MGVGRVFPRLETEFTKEEWQQLLNELDKPGNELLSRAFKALWDDRNILLKRYYDVKDGVVEEKPTKVYRKKKKVNNPSILERGETK